MGRVLWAEPAKSRLITPMRSARSKIISPKTSSKRQPPKRSPPAKSEAVALAAPDTPHDNPWQASQALAAKSAVLALNPFLKDAVPDADQGKLPVASQPEPATDPSLDDLLALMLARP